MTQPPIAAGFEEFDDSDSTNLPSPPQAQLRSEPVTIRTLIEQRDRFSSVPSYQRQQVWPLRWKKQLVDSILLGDNIGRFEGHEITDDRGKTTWVVDDGFQRISAILAFADGKFKTMAIDEKQRLSVGMTDPPVEPGKKFPKFTTYARDCFLRYQIFIDRTRPMSEAQRLERFLRIQNQAPLMSGEILSIYNSRAKHHATSLERHSFWKKCYRGRNSRGQVFRGGLYLLGIETSPHGFLNLRGGTRIKAIAAGIHDKLMTDELLEEIIARLDVAAHLFDELTFSEIAVLAAIYQSVLILEQSGYRVQNGDKGKLTAWMSEIINAAKHLSGIPYQNEPLFRLLYESGQRKFWNKHISTIFRALGQPVPETFVQGILMVPENESTPEDK